MKRIFTWLPFFLIAAIAFVPAAFAAELSSVTPKENALFVEQVQAKAPMLQVWFRSADGLPQADALQADLNGVPLQIDDVQLVSDTQETQVYFLVDCSTSTTAAQMQAVKQALTAYADNLRAGERATLISFGVDISVLAQDTQDVAALREAAATLQPAQAGTRFLDALAQTAQLAGREETALARKTIYVFSDSVDYNLGGYTQAEVEALLVQAGAPLYALGFDTGSKAELDALGALARTSGGEISVVTPATLGGALEAFWAQGNDLYTAQLTAPNNRIQNTPQTLTLHLHDNSAQRQVWVRHSTPDTQPPRILSVVQQSEDSLLLNFSEAVTGAQKAESYTVQTESGSLLGIAAVSYDTQAHTALLTLAAPPAQAKLQITCPGIVDDSAQENALTEATQTEFTGPLANAETAASISEDGAFPAAWALLTLLCVGLLLIIAFAVIRRRGGIVLREKKLEFADSRTVVEQPVFAAQADQVHVVQVPTSTLHFDVTGAGGAARRLTLPMQGTLFVGRSDVCDVIFDDTTMSRQHFVIEETNGQYTLANLSENGGTFLNGVAVQKPRPLQPGDVIDAGQTRIVFANAQKGGAV